MLIGQTITMYFDDLRRTGKSEATVECYRKPLVRLRRYLTELYNRELHIDEVKSVDLERFMAQELDEAKYSSSHRHSAITALKGIFKFSTRKGACPIDIGRFLQQIKVITKEREYINEDELTRILAHIRSHAVKALLQTIFYSGLRVGECQKLKLNDVDFAKGLIYVWEGKGGKERFVPLNDRLRPILLNYINNGRWNLDNDNFFSSKSGSISNPTVCEFLKPAVKKAGIKKEVTTHLLRHSFASNMIGNGVDLFRVQRLMGHNSIETTKVYLHTTMEELAMVVNLL